MGSNPGYLLEYFLLYGVSSLGIQNQKDFWLKMQRNRVVKKPKLRNETSQISIAFFEDFFLKSKLKSSSWHMDRHLLYINSFQVSHLGKTFPENLVGKESFFLFRY